jgi:hypothetical protein
MAKGYATSYRSAQEASSMRIAIVALAALLLAGPLPSAAQESAVPDPAMIGDNVERDFWCAAAFGIAARNATVANDTATADALTANVSTLLQRLATQLLAAGNSRDDFNALTSRYAASVIDPFRPAESTFSREDCDGAVAEAATLNTTPAVEPPAETSLEPQIIEEPAQ